MEILILYATFTLATAIYAHFYVLMPVINKVYIEVPQPIFVKANNSKYLLAFVLDIITILFAPVMFIICLAPGLSTIFSDALFKELKKS